MRGAAAGALALALALAPVAVGLSACGSGGAASTTTIVAATPPASTGSAPATTATSAPAGTATTPAAEASPAAPSSGSGSSSKGGAASFRVAHGDNSIPDYGQEAHVSERVRATAALAAYLRARAGGEWAKACSLLAAPTRTQLERLGQSAKRGGGCGKILAGLSSAPAATRADPLVGGIAALRVKGSSAFVLFHGPHGSKYLMPMRDEDGAWTVGQLAPLPYPLGSSGAGQ